jgi:hypothetical protein
MVDSLILDWSKPFINHIYTVDQNEQCYGDDEPILAQVWFGIEHMCVDTEGWATKGSTCSKGGRCDNYKGGNCPPEEPLIITEAWPRDY